MRRRYMLVAISTLAASTAARSGAYGFGSFENDDALDWQQECVRAQGAKSVAEALNGALSLWARMYLQAPEASRAIAAAEVVAAFNGSPSPELPEPLQAWIKQQPKEPFLTLRPLARKAVTRIAKESRSELRSLWSEGDGEFYSKWQKVMDGLLRRLVQ